MSKILYLSLAIILIFSLSGHLIDFNHVHHHANFEEGSDAIRHSSEQKWLALAISLLVLIGTFLFKPQRLHISTPSNGFIFDIVQIFEPTRKALRLGIIHPKLCS